MGQKKNWIVDLEKDLEDKNGQIRILEGLVAKVNNSLDFYHLPKVVDFDVNKLFQRNKILNVVCQSKPCLRLLEFLEVQDVYGLSATCKAVKGHLTNHPAFLRVMVNNAVFDRINLNTTLLEGIFA